ncbi:glycosyl hydrolase [Massilia yuzhufengensis]|uniref:glycosyl hydrolase n=1 Tax=Massilia yuzhufengensis TaxID=1164594 RepID=UPI00351CDB54
MAAESLTSAMSPLAFAPSDLRPMIHTEFASGVNLPVIHTSVHRPPSASSPTPNFQQAQYPGRRHAGRRHLREHDAHRADAGPAAFLHGGRTDAAGPERLAQDPRHELRLHQHGHRPGRHRPGGDHAHPRGAGLRAAPADPRAAAALPAAEHGRVPAVASLPGE